MPAYVHQDEDMVYACPNCDRAGQAYRRKEPEETTDGCRFKCQECGVTFDEPVEREDQSTVPEPNTGPTGGIGAVLDEADPDAIGGD